MSETPKCPYCGDSTSPQLEIPADSTDSQIEAKARASVMRRVEAENRVLTFDEFAAHADRLEISHKSFEITELNEDESRYYLFGTCKACGTGRYRFGIDKKIFEDIKKRRTKKMKTPDEIKKGLYACGVDECHGQHTDCPYNDGHSEPCIMNVCGDALAYIEQLESRVKTDKE